MKEYRASTFHPPTLEMLDELGVAESLIALGLVADRFQYRDRKEGLIAEFDLTVLKDHTRFPFRLQIDQYALSQLLFAQLQGIAVADVRFGHRVEAVALGGDHAVVTAETANGLRRFRAPYLIGADGANSAVRRSIGIDFEGMTYPERYITLFTPYINSVNQAMRDFLEDHGIEVLNIGSFCIEDDLEMACLPPEAIRAAAIEANHPDADAVFISCTAIRAVEILDDAEAALGKPVLSAIQCLFWDALRLAGYDKPIAGYGSLLRA